MIRCRRALLLAALIAFIAFPVSSSAQFDINHYYSRALAMGNAGVALPNEFPTLSPGYENPANIGITPNFQGQLIFPYYQSDEDRKNGNESQTRDITPTIGAHISILDMSPGQWQPRIGILVEGSYLNRLVKTSNNLSDTKSLYEFGLARLGIGYCTGKYIAIGVRANQLMLGQLFYEENTKDTSKFPAPDLTTIDIGILARPIDPLRLGLAFDFGGRNHEASDNLLNCDDCPDTIDLHTYLPMQTKLGAAYLVFDPIPMTVTADAEYTFEEKDSHSLFVNQSIAGQTGFELVYRLLQTRVGFGYLHDLSSQKDGPQGYTLQATGGFGLAIGKSLIIDLSGLYGLRHAEMDANPDKITFDWEDVRLNTGLTIIFDAPTKTDRSGG